MINKGELSKCFILFSDIDYSNLNKCYLNSNFRNDNMDITVECFTRTKMVSSNKIKDIPEKMARWLHSEKSSVVLSRNKTGIKLYRYLTDNFDEILKQKD